MFIQVRYVQLQPHIYMAQLNMLTPNKFDTFSSNFYQHHNFYNLPTNRSSVLLLVKI